MTINRLAKHIEEKVKEGTFFPYSIEEDSLFEEYVKLMFKESNHYIRIYLPETDPEAYELHPVVVGLWTAAIEGSYADEILKFKEIEEINVNQIVNQVNTYSNL